MAISLPGHSRYHGVAGLNSGLAPGTYLTDESRLYCYLGEDGGAALLLEDCRTFEVIACSEAELAAAGMRIVDAGRHADAALREAAA